MAVSLPTPVPSPRDFTLAALWSCAFRDRRLRFILESDSLSLRQNMEQMLDQMKDPSRGANM